MSKEPPARVCLGVIVAAHGVRGQVKVKPFTAEPRGIAAYGPLTDEGGERRFRLTPVGIAKGSVLARIDGIDDRDAAEALRGTRLYVDRAALPPPEEDEYYHADLVGLRAETAAGRPLGQVVAAHDFGAGDMLEVAPAGGGATVMYPFSRAVVPVVDIAGGRVVIEPPAEVVVPPSSEADTEEEAEAGAPEEAETGKDADVAKGLGARKKP